MMDSPSPSINIANRFKGSFQFRARRLSLAIGSGTFFLLTLTSPLWGQEGALPAPAATTYETSWFDINRLNVFLTLAITFFLIMYCIEKAKQGKNLFVRRIAGLDAIEEAVGRATEMGKPIL